MIKAEELRIGNLVKTNTDTVVPIRGGGINAIEQGALEVFPIDLSEEWLLKFGLENTGSYWVNDDINILQSPGGKNFLLSVGTEYTLGEPFEFVHQFQNLYFALKGEELPIKEKVS